MIPAPAPVTTIQPCSTMRRPNVTAATEAGSPAGVRADPNTVTFGTSAYGAKTLNEYRSSLRAVLVILRSPVLAPSSYSLRTVISIWEK